MSRTTPISFYKWFVVPNLEDLDKPDDIRRGFNATIPAFQLADIMYFFYKRNDPSKVSSWKTKRDLLRTLVKRESNFIIIQSVATAYKHLYAEGPQSQR
jgi:hypothetical protein